MAVVTRFFHILIYFLGASESLEFQLYADGNFVIFARAPCGYCDGVTSGSRAQHTLK
jgi:hypothetical protein